MQKQGLKKSQKNNPTDKQLTQKKITKFQQDIDDIHIVIQSQQGIINPSSYYKPTSTSTKSYITNTQYHIYIDDDTNIDVSVNFKNGNHTKMIKSDKNNRYQYGVKRGNNEALKQYSSTSRVRTQNDYPRRQKYTINHESNLKQDINFKMKKISDQHANLTQSQQSIHIQNINGLHKPKSQHIQNKQQVYINKDMANKNVTKQKQQKNFNISNNQQKKQGKIVKNRQYSKQIKLNQSNVNNQQKQFSYITPNKINKDTDIIQNNSMPKIQLINSITNNSYNKNDFKSTNNVQSTIKKQNLSKQTQKQKVRQAYQNYRKYKIQELKAAQNITPTKYNTQPQQEQLNNTQSPNVFNYIQNSPNLYENTQKQFLIDDNIKKRPKIFQYKVYSNHKQFNSQLPIQEQDKIQSPPYNKFKTTQSQILIRSPNNKDILKITKNVKNNQQFNSNHKNQTTNKNTIKPSIIIPTQKSQANIYNSTNNKNFATNQIKRLHAQLSNSNHKLYDSISKSKQKTKIIDDPLFNLHKKKYLNKLKQQQRHASKFLLNKTFSKNKHYSLSPDCQQITSRLSQTRVKVCPKFVEYQQRNRRKQIFQNLEQYTIIRRYLMENQIWDIVQGLEEQGIPQRKWPMKLVDIVYSRLKTLKIE